MKPLIRCLLLALLASTARAGDWWMYGFDGKEFLFYSSDIVNDGDLRRVWTESVPRVDIARRENQKQSDAFVNAIAEKVAHYVVPPYSVIHPTKGTAKEAVGEEVDILVREKLVSDGDVKASQKVFFKINCRQHQVRVLGGVIYHPSRPPQTLGEASFEYIIPDSLGADLETLVCRGVQEH